jgi:hypothetical protein
MLVSFALTVKGLQPADKIQTQVTFKQTGMLRTYCEQMLETSSLVISKEFPTLLCQRFGVTNISCYDRKMKHLLLGMIGLRGG